MSFFLNYENTMVEGVVALSLCKLFVQYMYVSQDGVVTYTPCQSSQQRVCDFNQHGIMENPCSWKLNGHLATG
jgi:hypothetical protein